MFFETTGGIQLLRSRLGGGVIQQNANVCELGEGHSWTHVNATVPLWIFESLIPIFKKKKEYNNKQNKNEQKWNK